MCRLLCWPALVVLIPYSKHQSKFLISCIVSCINVCVKSYKYKNTITGTRSGVRTHADICPLELVQHQTKHSKEPQNNLLKKIINH